MFLKVEEPTLDSKETFFSYIFISGPNIMTTGQWLSMGEKAGEGGPDQKRIEVF
jgi:hypothetical protein